MRQAVNTAYKGGSASSALALRTSIQQVVSRPTAEGIRALFSQSLIPQQAAELWDTAVKNKLVTDAPLCYAYLGYQAHKGDPESVRRAMEQMSSTGFLHTEKTYEYLIRAHINTKNTVGLLKSFFQLAQANVETTEKGIQTSILTYFSRHPHYIELVELFLAITSTTPKPQYNVLYHSVINELHKSSHDFRSAQRIQQLLREMETLGILPLPVTFEVLLHSEAIDFETALQLFNKMRKHQITTVYAYAGMIQRNGQQGRIKESMRLWNELISHDITPSPSAYLAVMQPLAQRGRSREVLRLIHDMSSRGVRVSLLAYTILVQAFLVEGSLARAIGVLDDMATHRVKPDEKLFGILVRAHMDAEDLQASVNLVERAHTINVEAGGLLSIMISAFGDTDSREAHDALIKQIDDKKIEITQETRDAIERRKLSVPFPPGSPPFSFRQQRYSLSSSETHTPQSTIPLHLPTQPLQPLQPQQPIPPYAHPYPMQYQVPYAYYPPQPIYIAYDPNQPQFAYQYPPQPNQAQPTHNPSENSSTPPSPPESSNFINTSSIKQNIKDQDSSEPSTDSSIPHDISSSENSPNTPFESSSPRPNNTMPVSSTPPPPLSYSHPLPLAPRAPLPEPSHSSHPYFSKNTNTNSNTTEEAVRLSHTKRGEKQRVQRQNERQEKKIQKLIDRNELNNFIISKLNRPLPPNEPLLINQPVPPDHPLHKSTLLSSPSPPNSSLSTSNPSPSLSSSDPSVSLPNQVLSEDYKRELEQMMKTIQQKLEAFNTIQQNKDNKTDNDTKIITNT